MSILKTISLLVLASVIVSGNSSELNKIIHRINEEINAATAYFIGFENEFFGEFLQNSFNVPIEMFTKLHSDNDTNLNRNIILVVRASSNFQQFHDAVFLRTKYRRFVVVSAENHQTLEKCFQFFWEISFTRIFGVIQDTTYAYLPFDGNPIQKFSTFRSALPNSLKNLNGFAIRSTLGKEPPNVFLTTDKKGHRCIKGYIAELLFAFLRNHNATFKEVIIPDMDVKAHPAVLKSTLSKEIDIAVNIYAHLWGLVQSFPIKMTKWTVLVPLNGYVDPNQYFLKPFSPALWACIVLAVIFLTAIDMITDKLMNSISNFWLSFTRVYLIVLNMSLHRPATNAYRFRYQAHFLAFIFTNLYLIYVTSYLTVRIKVKQYDTIQDLIDYHVPVLMVDYDWKTYLQIKFQPAEFGEIVVLEREDNFFKQMNSMRNTSFAYIEGAHHLEYLLALQKNKRFQLIRDSLAEYYLGFVLVKHSPYIEILNQFIIQAFSTGLIDKWEEDATRDAFNAGLIQIDSTSVEEKKPLTLHHFGFAWKCWTLGLAISMAVFVGEHLGVVYAKCVCIFKKYFKPINDLEQN